MKLIIIILCIFFVAFTNAKIFKLLKKKGAVKGLLGNSIKKGSPILSDSSIYGNLVLSSEESVPSNAIPVLIVPLSPPTLVQQELLTARSLPESGVSSGSISLNSPFLNTFSTAYYAENQQPSSYLNGNQYYQYPAEVQLLPIELQSILENPTSSDATPSSATVTVNIPEYNPLIDVRTGFNTINSQPTVQPIRSYQFIPAKISSRTENAVLQQHQIVPTYASSIQDIPSIITTNSHNGNYNTSYTLKDGTFVTEKGEFINGKDGKKILVKSGTYQRRGDNGEIVPVKWIADENGFRVLE